MEVKQYIFQSPYSSQVQFGRLDPSSVQKEQTSKEDTLNLTDQTKLEAKVVQNELESKPTIEVSSPYKIDIYA